MNVGLLSTLTGIRSGPGTSAPTTEPPTGGTPFVSALMEALGLAGKTGQSDAASADGQAPGGELQSLLAMLSTAPEAGYDAEDADLTSSRGSLTASRGSESDDAAVAALARRGITRLGGRSPLEAGAAAAGWGMSATPGLASASAPSASLVTPSEGLGRTGTGAFASAPQARSAETVPVDALMQNETSVRGRVSGAEKGSSAETGDGFLHLVHDADSAADAGARRAEAHRHPSPESSVLSSFETALADRDGRSAMAASPFGAESGSTAPSSTIATSKGADPVPSSDADVTAPVPGVPESVPGASESLPGTDASIAVDSLAGAAALPATGSALPVTVADPSLDKVDPALRARVERVMERMRDEFGHEVTVVEGYRSPDRQAHLYEQGRSRPGQVATWTRRSWHSEGLAADLMVDGTYDDPLAYARLQRVAREEGLKTLGSRDMGHVELPGATTERAEVAAAPSRGRRFVGVARPAAVAASARVAQVATPGQWVTDAPAEPARPGLPADLEIVAEGTTAGSSSDPKPQPEAAPRSDLASPFTETTASATGSSRAAVTGVGSTEASAVEQAARIQELRAMTEAAQPSRVSVRLDTGEQMRVGLLDRTVDATLDISDPERAATIRSRVAELHQALESRGLDLGALSVNGTNQASGTTGSPGWLAGAGDPASEIIRTLLGGGAGEHGTDGRERTLADERTRNQEGSDSNRSRRDAEKEHDE